MFNSFILGGIEMKYGYKIITMRIDVLNHWPKDFIISHRLSGHENEYQSILFITILYNIDIVAKNEISYVVCFNIQLIYLGLNWNEIWL